MAFNFPCLPTKDQLNEVLQELFDDEDNLSDQTWSRLSETVKSLFRRRRLRDGELEGLRNIIKRILFTKSGKFLFEWCQNIVFKEGVEILRVSINEKKGMSILAVIEEVWVYFYGEILPTIQAIFTVPRLTPQKLTVRQAVLVEFRNGVALQFALDDLITAMSVTPTLQQMLLVLQSVQDTYPPNAEREALEVIVAQAVNPYMGFHGYYTGCPTPVIESNEPQLAAQRRSSAENRRLSRPLSMQPNQIDSLSEMFRTAAARTSSVTEA